MTALKEDTAEREATVVRDHQAVNRRTLVDDMIVPTTTIMMTMRTNAITEDMSNIAIAIMTDDGMTQVPKATIAEEHADLDRLAIRPTGLDTQDIDRGQVPLTEIHSRRPALIGQIHVPEHRDSHPVTTRDLTNILTTSSNTTQAEDTVNHPTVNNIINTHMSITAPKDRHFYQHGQWQNQPRWLRQSDGSWFDSRPQYPWESIYFNLPAAARRHNELWLYGYTFSMGL